jgi:hypothetical protein
VTGLLVSNAGRFLGRFDSKLEDELELLDVNARVPPFSRTSRAAYCRRGRAG